MNAFVAEGASLDPSGGRLLLVLILASAATVFGYTVKTASAHSTHDQRALPRKTSSPSPQSATTEGPSHRLASPGDAAVSGSLSARERRLVSGLIGADDISQSAAVRAHVTQVLNGLGVDIIEVPAGIPVDAHLHNIVSVTRAEYPEDDQRVRNTERPGWRHLSGELIRAPEVAVWKQDKR